MRPEFRDSLMKYSKKDKEMMAAKTGTERGKITQGLEGALDEQAKENKTTREAELRVFNIQPKKQEIMRRLKEDLKKIDNPEAHHEQPPGTILITQRDGQYFRGRTPVTYGALITDGDWGLRYYLDPESVPRAVRKEFFVEEAKRKLQIYLDDQIIIEEIARIEEFVKEERKPKPRPDARLKLMIKQTDEGKPNPDNLVAYQALKEERASGKETGGHALERMVRNFFRKLKIDRGLPFSVESTDLFQDVEQKIDFIFRRPNRSRGVGVQEGETTEGMAIQLTQDTRPETLERKQRQLHKARQRLNEQEKVVADIILVVMSSDAGSETVSAWRKAGSPSGGPDGRWDPQLKEKVFRTVLKGFMSRENIDALWEKVK